MSELVSQTAAKCHVPDRSLDGDDKSHPDHHILTTTIQAVNEIKFAGLLRQGVVELY